MDQNNVNDGTDSNHQELGREPQIRGRVRVPSNTVTSSTEVTQSTRNVNYGLVEESRPMESEASPSNISETFNNPIQSNTTSSTIQTRMNIIKVLPNSTQYKTRLQNAMDAIWGTEQPKQVITIPPGRPAASCSTNTTHTDSMPTNNRRSDSSPEPKRRNTNTSPVATADRRPNRIMRTLPQERRRTQATCTVTSSSLLTTEPNTVDVYDINNVDEDINQTPPQPMRRYCTRSQNTKSLLSIPEPTLPIQTTVAKTTSKREGSRRKTNLSATAIRKKRPKRVFKKSVHENASTMATQNYSSTFSDTTENAHIHNYIATNRATEQSPLPQTTPALNNFSQNRIGQQSSCLVENDISAYPHSNTIGSPVINTGVLVMASATPSAGESLQNAADRSAEESWRLKEYLAELAKQLIYSNKHVSKQIYLTVAALQQMVINTKLTTNPLTTCLESRELSHYCLQHTPAEHVNMATLLDEESVSALDIEQFQIVYQLGSTSLIHENILINCESEESLDDKALVESLKGVLGDSTK